MARDRSAEGTEVAVWPAWVRYLVLAAVVAVAGTGLVTLLYDRQLLPLAGPFAALLVAPLVVGVALWWWSRRLGRSEARLRDGLSGLIEELDRERARPGGQRASGAPDDALDSAAGRARKALSQLSFGHQPQALQELDRMQRTTVPWRRQGPLADRLRDVERARSAMTRAQRRIERVARSRSIRTHDGSRGR